MYLVMNIFHAKPGKAKALVETFKKAMPMVESAGLAKNTRILTDTASTFWTVVIESEVEDLNAYMDMAKTLSQKPEFAEIAKNYAEYATGGHREIFKIE
jgi:heme-degrading monooxygenase HmoA